MKTQTYTLKDISLNICDGVHNTVIDDENGDCYLLSAKNIKNGVITFDNTDRKINRETKNQLTKRTKLSTDDVVITTVGTIGELAIVDERCTNYEFQRSVGIIKCNKKFVIPQFLFYLLESGAYNYFFHVIATGAAQPCIFLSTLNKLKVQLPPLPTQQKIASILSAYDDLIQNYKKQIEALQTAASELYKEWFVRFRFPGYQTTEFENGIPEGWKVEKVKNCVNRLPFGQTYKKDELEPEGNVIVIDQSEDEYLGYHNNESSHKASAEKPIALFGDHSCKYKLMIKDFSLGENIIPYTSKGVDLYYLYYSVYKIVQTEEYKRHWNLFVNKKVLIPNNELQKSFRQKVIPIFKQIEMLYKQITNLTQQRDLLLPRLMSGKLEV